MVFDGTDESSDEEGYVLVDASTDLTSLTVAMLREELELRGLAWKSKDRKATLIERLEEVMKDFDDAEIDDDAAFSAEDEAKYGKFFAGGDAAGARGGGAVQQRKTGSAAEDGAVASSTDAGGAIASSASAAAGDTGGESSWAVDLAMVISLILGFALLLAAAVRYYGLGMLTDDQWEKVAAHPPYVCRRVKGGEEREREPPTLCCSRAMCCVVGYTRYSVHR
jgi:hypothetical protein